MGVLPQMPVAVSQTSAVQMLPSLQSLLVRQQPSISFWTQRPVDGLQAPAVQTLPSSIWVQSSHAAPFRPQRVSLWGVTQVLPLQQPPAQV
jgi:hypothetical protein